MRDYTLLDIDVAPIDVDGSKQKTYSKQGLTITIRTGDARIASIATPEIDYSVDRAESLQEVLKSQLKKTIMSLKGYKKRTFMIVGLGNAGMTADMLGVKTLQKVHVTPFVDKSIMPRRRVCTFAPSVMGLTAIDSNEAVLGMTKIVEPDIVVLVDTLATSDIFKLARVVQVKNTGIIPGGGVGSNKPSLNMQYLGVPVISIGVPLVIYLRHVVATFLDEEPTLRKMDDSIYSLIVTPKEVDYTVDYFSTIIAKAIDLAIEEL